MPVLSIAWAESSRVAQTLAARLGAEFQLLACPREWLLARWVRYARMARRTQEILRTRRPDLVLVQNPPIQAVAAVAAYARKYHRQFIIDAHSGAFLNSGLVAVLHREWFRMLASQALMTLVHNQDLVPWARSLCPRLMVLEMAVPVPVTSRAAALERPAVVVIRGGGRDEPLFDLLGAAQLLPHVHFYLTGHRPAGIRLPANVQPSGFLAEPAYWELLNGADVILALTTREATVLSGAYEGLAAGKPLVLSRTRTLSQVFPCGAVLVANQAQEIAAGIELALAQAQVLSAAGAKLKTQKAEEWQGQFQLLQQLVATNCEPAATCPG